MLCSCASEANRCGGPSLTPPAAATLRMPTWVTYKSKWAGEKYLNGVFQTLNEDKTKTLFIDLRGNEGGTDPGNDPVSRFLPKEITIEGEKRLVRYRKASSVSLTFMSHTQYLVPTPPQHWI